jgi:hypothetical protein
MSISKTQGQPETPPDKTVARFDLSNGAQLQVKLSATADSFIIQLANRHKQPQQSLPECLPESPQERRAVSLIKLPLDLLPELKRALAQLEHTLANRAADQDEPHESENNQHQLNFAANGEVEGNEPIEEEDYSINPRRASFAHESEQEFAQILDFYQIEWLYEPCTFAIRWDEEGNVVESFTPDFYLPEQDQYIELTTLKQELVTKKNRKVRLLKGLYPGINIKIIYGKDYRRLLEKYATKLEKKEEGPK